TARIVLTRELGAAQAAAFSAQVFGRDRLLFPHAPPPRRRTEPDARTGYEMARAAHLRDALLRVTARPETAAEDAGALLQAVEPNVARAALAMLRNRRLPGDGRSAFDAVQAASGGIATRIAGWSTDEEWAHPLDPRLAELAVPREAVDVQ